ALSLDSGQPVWDEPFSSQAGIYSAFASWQNYIFFLTSDGMLHALDVTTKRSGWNRSRRFTSVSPLAGMAVFGDVLYITSGAYVTAVQAASGRRRWEAIVPGVLRFAPAISPDAVVCVTDDGRMHAFNTNGKRIFRTGIDLNSMAVASPSFSGRVVAIPTSNGSLNLVNPLSGQILWNFTVPPMIKRTRLPDQRTQSNSGSLGQATGSSARTEEIEVKYVVAAGPTSTEGDTLLMLALDGSILAFDKNLGVDLTHPEVSMAWPNPGDQVSGRAPMEMVFRVTDAGSGVNFDLLEISINGQEYIHEIDREGLVRLRIYQRGINKTLANGRARVIVAASDWMGNSSTTVFTLTVDNTLPALGSPGTVKSGDDLGAGGPAGRGGGGRGGGRGGG
ncbi:MAG: PQQ-like beta-propeller repeat protein, partial [Armatimonadetes bacterium]|nr:PQQ-like beta-propeller repeat protein [Armatimonadota bacterium]